MSSQEPTANLWHLPALIVLLIYLPGALFGLYVFCNEYAVTFFFLLGLFVASYYFWYPRFAASYRRVNLRSLLWRLGDRINWHVLAWLAVVAYLITIIVATLTTEYTPVGAA